MICDAFSCQVFSSVCRELERIDSRFPLFYYGCHGIIFENYALEITEIAREILRKYITQAHHRQGIMHSKLPNTMIPSSLCS